MPLYGTQGQFGGMYQNPQMGGTMNQQQQWALGNWQQNVNQARQTGNPWEQMGFDPQNPFGQTYFNPYNSLQGPFRITPKMMQNQALQQVDYGNQLTQRGLQGKDWLNPGLQSVVGPAGQNALWMEAGNLHMDPNAMGMFGFGAGGGAPGFKPWEGGGYQAPGPWQAPDQGALSSVDPDALVNSWLPYMQEQRESGFAEAAARMGPSSRGGVMSTPYAQALGDVSRRSTEDLARLAAGVHYDAEMQRAQQEWQAQQAALNRDLASWQTQGGWQQQGNMADLANQFAAWQAENAYGLDKYGLDMQNQLMQQNFLSNLLGGIFGAVG